MTDYSFTNNWFDVNALATWDFLIPNIKPKKILEVGSFEGRSATYLIDKLGSEHNLEVHCVDTWAGGIEHSDVNMGAVEGRFDANVAKSIQNAKNNINLIKHKGMSDMCNLITDGHSGTFDFIYIDGSHQAPDVLGDAYLGFKLLKVGGIMVFDDYIWYEELPYGRDPIRCPKMAIDAVTNIFFRKIQFIRTIISQVYIQKVSE